LNYGLARLGEGKWGHIIMVPKTQRAAPGLGCPLCFGRVRPDFFTTSSG
jgi:hypothetical protein